MPGENIYDWSVTAADNGNADTSINFAEGQPRASVNDSARSMMAAHAKKRNLENGSITTGGSVNAQTFTSGVGYTAPIPTGLTVRLKVGFTNTGATTLNMDGIGAVAIKDQAGLDIGANALLLGRYVDLLYNGTNWILLAAGASAAPFDALAYNGMQINGSMEVSQEFGTTGTPIANKYPIDGWLYSFNGTGSVTAAQIVSGPAGFTNCLQMSVGVAQATMGSNDYFAVFNMIEGYRWARLAWGTASAQPITIGFWTSHDAVGIYSVLVKNNASTRAFAANYTQNVTNTWEYKTVTVPGCTDAVWEVTNNRGALVSFPMACGPNLTAPSANAWVTGNYIAAPGQINAVAGGNNFRLTGVVVLPGTEAPSAARSPFIMRPYDQELVMCQRYFEWCPYNLAFYSTVGGAEWHGTALSFSVTKRAVPTLSSVFADPATTQASGNASTFAANNATTTGCLLTQAPTTTGMSYLHGFRFSADARL